MLLATDILDSAIEDFDEHPEQKQLVHRIFGINKRQEHSARREPLTPKKEGVTEEFAKEGSWNRLLPELQ